MDNIYDRMSLDELKAERDRYQVKVDKMMNDGSPMAPLPILSTRVLDYLNDLIKERLK